MISDTVEYGEWKFKVRSEGITYAAYSFSQKFSTAIAGFGVSMILAFSDYVPKQKIQPQEAYDGIRATMTLIPIVFLLFSIAIMYFYKIDRNLFTKMQEEIKSRKV